MRAFALAVFAVLLAGCTQSSTQEHAAPEPDSGTGEVPLGPSWAFTDTDGAQRSRDGALGAPAGLFFMATWCNKCQAVAPRLASVESEFEGRGFQMHTVSWDPQEDTQDLEDWKVRYDQDWPHGVDEGARIAQAFGITSQSSIVILDAQGNPVKTWVYDTPSAGAIRSAIEDAYTRS